MPGEAVVALDGAQQQAIEDCVAGALERARRSGAERLASCTLELAGELDPTAVAMAARRHGEAWFCLEQPARGGRALATLGEVRRIVARGSERFAELS
ncbi:MAG: isochorismate synthase, partial [Solirubrobacteraceae bacterium]